MTDPRRTLYEPADVVNHIGVARDLVLGGVGLGILPKITCQNNIRAKRLVRVLTDWESPSLQISATFLGRRKKWRRLRVSRLHGEQAKDRGKRGPTFAGNAEHS